MKSLLGATIWAALTVLGWLLISRIPAEARHSWSRAESELWRSVISSSPTVDVRFPPGSFVRPGDGVFVLKGDEVTRVGEVLSSREEDLGPLVVLRLDGSLPPQVPGRGSQVVLRTQRETFDHCIRVLVTEPQRRELEALWSEFLQKRQVRLQDRFERLLPGLLEAARDFLVDELDESLARHRGELEGLMQRYRSEVAAEHGIPLLIEEVWPIFEEEADTARALGRELWDRAPLFSFAWRAAWDGVMSDGPDRLEARFEDFLEDEAGPALREHEDEIRAAMSRVLRRVVASDTVRSKVRELAAETIQDPELRALVRRMIEEMLVGNPRLLEFLRARWTDPELRRELDELYAPTQNLLARAGNLLVFADPDDRSRIHPGLAKLLRLLLLKRDKRLLFLEIEEGPSLEEGEELRGRVEG